MRDEGWQGIMSAGWDRKGWRIGVDVGGTFTDLVTVDPSGRTQVFKVPSIPSDPGQGVLDSLEHAADAFSMSLSELLGACSLFVHGSTIATNTLLEHKGARVGLLVTEGFRDGVEIRRGIRPNPWAHREPYPPVLVPRYLRLPVGGRVGRDGAEVEPVAGRDVRAAAESFREDGVEAVAVCLHNSFLTDLHERQVAECLRRCWGGEWVSLSAEVAPIMGEYERTSTTVVNSYVAPRTVRYLRRLEERLEALGLRVPLLLIQNNGGAITGREVASRPAALLLSGPAAGAAMLSHYGASAELRDLISMEIGGTSCDVILMQGGEVPLTDSLDIEGYDVALPSIEVHTIGAGGGTIARVDKGGMLAVGPDGAGAQPGPACYGRGGGEPTVTDAQLVLGRLHAGSYAGGAISLDQSLAQEAIRSRIAATLGLTIEAAAAGVVRLAEQKILHALQRISVERGHDPRRFTLVAAGGAGPLHGVSVARLLGCRRVYVPRLAGAFCALGMLHTDVRHDYVRTRLSRLEKTTSQDLAEDFSAMRTEALPLFSREGFAAEEVRWLGACGLRYRGQQSVVRVPIDPELPDIEGLRSVFEAEHDRLYGHIQPEGAVEITQLWLSGIGAVPSLEALSVHESRGAAGPRETRPVWVDESIGWTATPVYDGATLAQGDRLTGPLLIDEATTTVFADAGSVVTLDRAGNYLIELQG